MKDDAFVTSLKAKQLLEDFQKLLVAKNTDLKFKQGIEKAGAIIDKFHLVLQWVSSYINDSKVDTD